MTFILSKFTQKMQRVNFLSTFRTVGIENTGEGNDSVARYVVTGRAHMGSPERAWGRHEPLDFI